MLDKLKDLFKEGLGYTHTAGVLQQISNLVQVLNSVYMKGEDDKNTAIDVVCDILQSHKDQPAAPIETTTPVTEAPVEVPNAVN